MMHCDELARHSSADNVTAGPMQLGSLASRVMKMSLVNMTHDAFSGTEISHDETKDKLL